MVTTEGHCMQTLEVKQSKFIAHLIPYDQYDALLEALRSEHPKARHFVTAFRYLNEHDQVVEGSSDDGEPKGTSGKPTLSVLQGKELIHAAIITVRYFGGTKLGTGGLVRAYSDAANLVLEHASLIPYVSKFRSRFFCEYQHVSRIDYLAEQAGLTIVDKSFEPVSVGYVVEGPADSLTLFEENSGRLVSEYSPIRVE